MKCLGKALILVATLAGSKAVAGPDADQLRSMLEGIEASIPRKAIKRVAILPNKPTQGGDVELTFADGTTRR